MSSIKVAVRCRPFVIDDQLGVILNQRGEEDGEIELINVDYSTKRFAFSYAWWTAYGYKRHCAEADMGQAEAMELINQHAVFDQCGGQIRDNILAGDAVVMFAYGLSGSGKTFTVFGPDAPDAPDAWFKHMEPIDAWGLLPRIAYDIFKLKSDGWSIKMKYFQNVVDIVRDLMDPVGQERVYKNGMRRDQDGFMDIEWCKNVPIKDWQDLTDKFQEANSRKAISPTQFNHQSTRGHCIMVLEVEKPKDENPEMKSKGRLYVCDLAGTEPAADIFYAMYEKKVFDDGTVEHELKGPHPDQKKTKELQEQGKKINLSLSEMAQFFLKMAQAYKAGKLVPGKSIPGCNSFFLCRFLKDTLLQSKVYLFCAIRPEVTYAKYTFATLGFAKNASVVQLKPKQASVAASPAERKLMQELADMKAMFEQLAKERDTLKGQVGDGNDGDMNAEQEQQLQEMLAAKQKQIETLMMGGGSKDQSAADQEDKYLEQQKQEYARRGISLAHFASGTEFPYFCNLDEDSYRSKRYLYVLEKEVTVFGQKGDIQPMSMLIKAFCSARVEEGGEVTLTGGNGETYVNGAKVAKGDTVTLQVYDRVIMGGELLMFYWKDHEPPEGAHEFSAEEAMTEYQEALTNTQAGGGDDGSAELRAQLDALKAERDKLKAENDKAADGGEAADGGAAPALDEERVLLLMKQTSEAQEVVNKLRADTINFDLTLSSMGKGPPKVIIQVVNLKSQSGDTVNFEEKEFVDAFAVVKDEYTKLGYAFEGGYPYTVPVQHDPYLMFFEKTFNLGNVRVFTEYLQYFLPTEAEDENLAVRRASAPYDNTGALLKVEWSPMINEDDDPPFDTVEDGSFDIDDPSDLIGKPWTYRLKISDCSNLPIMISMAYVEYEFFGERFASAPVNYDKNMFDDQDDDAKSPTRSPNLDYEFVHHVDCVTQEFIDWLAKGDGAGDMSIALYVSPFVQMPKSRCSTASPEVAAAFGKEPVIDDEEARQQQELKERMEKMLRNGGSVVDMDAESLQAENAALKAENAELKAALESAQAELRALKGASDEAAASSGTKNKLKNAKATDNIVNG